MKMKLTVVRTPTPLPLPSSSISLRDITTILNNELSTSSSTWNQECTDVLVQNLHALFTYDRFECAMTRAYGAAYKIALNPLMMICYHPDCRGAKHIVVRLRHIFDPKNYLMHLKKHSDAIGMAMQRRFAAVATNIFITTAELDTISPSPHSLNPYLNSTTGKRELPTGHEKAIESFGIDRKLKIHYLSHWKNELIAGNFIKSNALTYQEDDAYIYSLLHYPHAVRDWSYWNTISLYCMKMYAAVGGPGLSLYRGVTRTRQCIGAEKDDFETFVKNLNHPGLSVSSVRRLYPGLVFENELFHKADLLFHIKLLSKKDDSIKITFPGVTRYICTLGIDEQEINRGTFTHKNKLYGLKNTLTEDDIERIGLVNLPKHIAEENGFIADVREYHLTDFSGVYVSNVYSSFESVCMTYETCLKSLSLVSKLARQCVECLYVDGACAFTKLNEKCSNCVAKGCECIGMITFHNLWDMAPFQKKANKQCKTKITSISTQADFLNPELTTIGYGGLHMCKALVNCFRNNVLTLDGENYGLGILRTNKHDAATLSNIKSAVLIAKDRQSDLLAYMTVGSVVQEFLKKKKLYSIERVPEPFLTYTENAKTQRPITLPTSILANANGDVFVLDQRNCTVHVVDRSGVAKCYYIGSYGKPSLANYNTDSNSNLKTKDIKFSEHLSSMSFDRERKLYVADKGRGEVIMVRKTCPARMLASSTFNVIKFKGCESLCSLDDQMVVLLCKNGQKSVKIFEVEIPTGDEKHQLHVGPTVITSIVPSSSMRSIFSAHGTDCCFGEWCDSGEINFYVSSNGKKWQKEETHLKSSSMPCCSDCKLSTMTSFNELNHYTLKKSGIKMQVSSLQGKMKLSTPAFNFCQWKKVTFIVSEKVENLYCLKEFGPLQLGLKFSVAVMDLYEAISYFPPNAVRSVNLNLQQCIDLGSKCQELFEAMQNEAESRYSTRHSFIGTDGIPFTDTITCITDTVNSWRALKKRLDYFDPNIAKILFSHAVTNESYVEHTFGFIREKSQGNSLSVKEYKEAKRNHKVDFLLKMCDLPFSQYMSQKVRDKGYQDLQGATAKMVLNAMEVKQLLQGSNNPEQQEVDRDDGNDDSEMQAEHNVVDRNSMVYKAFLLSKTVPRQTTRMKYKQSSNYKPNMLETAVPSGKLLAGDLVFHKNIENKLKTYVVEKDYLLTNIDNSVKVCELAERSVVLMVDVSQLLVHRGLIICVPKELHSVSENSVILHDSIHEQVLGEILLASNRRIEEELLLLPNIEETDPDSGNEAAMDISNSDGETATDSVSSLVAKRHTEDEYESESEGVALKKKKSRKQAFTLNDDSDACDSDAIDGHASDINASNREDDEGENSSSDGVFVDELSPGDWLVSKFEISTRGKVNLNFYVGQILPFDEKEDGKPEVDELRVQFYRSDVSREEQVFVKLPYWEHVKKETVIEHVEKPEILSGGRIRLLSLPKSGKLV